ncbi:DUF4082 domain-containing protein [Tessaracoccus sp. OS52]|uniref:DUF4082 domain-containing protein n=1 Tax=Tessaracoccus sp. OS52 TaxID=2886691 RepID=UPI001D125B1F|nr:DUF4082 domain-containing protein [Tessaracoccus sp. OS52]MCC2594610.1 DUF4082 domain-containing protein [Tessaracoccus sp. OS52]
MRRIFAALAASLTLLVGLITVPTTVANATPSSGEGLFSDSLEPRVPATTDTRSINLGMKFSSDRTGSIAAVQFYRSAQQERAYEASIWELDGKLLATTTFPASSTAGWQTAPLAKPVNLNKGRWYVVSYLASDGQFASSDGVFNSDWGNGPLNARKWGGSYTRAATSVLPATSGRGTSYMLDVVFVDRDTVWTPQPAPSQTATAAPTQTATPTPEPTQTATPTPEPTQTATPTPEPTQTATPTPEPTQTPTPTPEPTQTPTPTPEPTQTPTPEPTTPDAAPAPSQNGEWPNESNTGVPDGVTLTPYTGPLTITTDNTVIRNALVEGTLRIQASNVQIVNSRINGGVDLRSPKTNDYSFTITDSSIHIGDNLNTGLMRGNFHANRVDITGGRRSVYCEYNCTVENSWVHDQGGDPGGDAHFSGIRMEQNGVFRHNTITCEALRGQGTGCSAGLTGYGDFAPVQNNLVEGNIFLRGGGGGSTVCAYGGSSGDDGSKPYGHLAQDIRFVDNVFVRGETGVCGNLGSIKSFDPDRPGNVWSGNTWDDGTTISYTGR